MEKKVSPKTDPESPGGSASSDEPLGSGSEAESEVQIPQGRGIPLKEIPTYVSLSSKLQQGASCFRSLHHMLFGVPGSNVKSRLENIGQWNGIPSDQDFDQFERQIYDVCTCNELLDISSRLIGISLPKTVTKQVLVRWFAEIFAKPSAENWGTEAPSPAVKRERTSTAAAGFGPFESEFNQNSGGTASKLDALKAWLALSDGERKEYAVKRPRKRAATPKKRGQPKKRAKVEESLVQDIMEDEQQPPSPEVSPLAKNDEKEVNVGQEEDDDEGQNGQVEPDEQVEPDGHVEPDGQVEPVEPVERDEQVEPDEQLESNDHSSDQQPNASEQSDEQLSDESKQ